MKVIKKDGTLEDYNFMKIRNAVTKSAKRVMIDLDDSAFNNLKEIVELRLSLLNTEQIPIQEMHNVVEESLEEVKEELQQQVKDQYNDTFNNVAALVPHNFAGEQGIQRIVWEPHIRQ